MKQPFAGRSRTLLASLLVISACAGEPEHRELSDVDYAVMSAAIAEIVARERFGGPPSRSDEERSPIERIVIIGQVDPHAPTTIGLVEPDSGAPMDSVTAADYATQADSAVFERRFVGINRYVLLPPAEMTEIFEAGGWPAFYDTWPGAPGFFALSRVGFNADRTEAVIHVLHLREGLWGHTSVMLFRLHEGRWTLVGEKGFLEF